MLAPAVFALLVAAVLALLGARARSRSAGTWALAWLAYAAYEWLMFRRVLCTGECNIRIDLLLIYPLFLLGTLVAAGRLAAKAIRSRRARRTR